VPCGRSAASDPEVLLAVLAISSPLALRHWGQAGRASVLLSSIRSRRPTRPLASNRCGVADQNAPTKLGHDVNFGQTGAKEILVASVFTTRLVTMELEMIRDVNAAPAPAAVDVTTYPLDSVTDLTFELQTTTAGFAQPASLITLFKSTPGIGTIAFSKYVSPDYRNIDRVIPPTKTKSGVPTALGSNKITFDLYVPSGTKPWGGWPVAIATHGATGHKNNATPVTIAATLASKGIATIGINGPGNVGGPLSELTVTRLATLSTPKSRWRYASATAAGRAVPKPRRPSHWSRRSPAHRV
jgi:hypothetical protein